MTERDETAGRGRGVGRREFLTAGIATAGTLGFTGSGHAETGDETAAKPATNDPRDPASGLPLRRFGKTGRTLPIFGIGSSSMVQRFIAGYGVPLPSMDERVAMVRAAYDAGVRYFDTARVYGESETIFGRALKGDRKNIFLATKAHTPDPSAVRASLEKSLEDLQTDYVDCLQIHSPAIEAVGFKRSMEIHAAMVKLRDEGLCKHIGLTTHVAFETVHKMIATGGFDQVLLAYGYFRKGMDTMLSPRSVELRDLCLAKAHELGMAIVAMKIFGASIMSHNSLRVVREFDEAKRRKMPAAALRWVASDRRVSMLNIGLSLPSDVEANRKILRGSIAVTPEDKAILAEFSAAAYGSETVKRMRVT